MRILVTGGAGFIGSNLVEELVEKGNDVIVLDKLSTGSLDNLKKVRNKIAFINDSCDNIQKLTLPEIDIIYHLGIASSSPMYKENPHLVGDVINDAINIFEYAKIKKIKKIIFASSSSLYSGLQPPHNENMDIKVTDFYTEGRLGIERIAELYNVLYGVKSVGLRFFSVYGPHEEAKGIYANIVTQFLWEMKKGKSPVIYGDGSQKRDFVFVKDIVKALMLVSKLECGYDIFNVGTGKSYSFNNVVDILNNKLNTKIKPIYVKIPMKNYIDCTLSDTNKMKNIGYHTEYNLERGLDEYI